MDPRAIHAKAPTTSNAARSAETAEALLSEIRRQLKAGEIRTAKRLAAEAAQSHPGRADILNLHRILNEGRSSTDPSTGRDMRPEYEWIRNPPKMYRGRWVALIGDGVVASAATLEELQETLPVDLDQTPLAIRIPS